MFIFQEVKSKDTIKDQVVVAWPNLVNYTQSYVLSGSFTEKNAKKSHNSCTYQKYVITLHSQKGKSNAPQQIALWCNGSTSDSGSACEGSNPPRQRNKGLNRNDLALYCVVHLSPMSNLVGTLSEYSIAISKNLCNFAYIGIKAF